MNTLDVLKYGHQTVLNTLQDLPSSEWETPNVCGVWSTRQIMAHLASYEQLLVELLGQFTGRQGETPHLDRLVELGPYGFNDYEVDSREGTPWRGVYIEYNHAHSTTLELAALIPAELLRQPGTLPWYGAEYALDDFIVYSYYGHKREHTAQINVFRDLLKQNQ